MPILKQKNAKSTEKVAVSEGFKPKVQVDRFLEHFLCMEEVIVADQLF